MTAAPNTVKQQAAPLLYRCPLIPPNKKPEVSGRDLDTWKRSRSLPFWEGDFLIPQKSLLPILNQKRYNRNFFQLLII